MDSLLVMKLVRLLLGPFVTLAACGGTSGAPDPQETPRTRLVETATGPVQGQEDGGVYTYFGIPYAAPPVRALRWEPPQPVEPWTDVLDTVAPEAPAVPGAPPVIRVNKCPQTLSGGEIAAPFLGPIDEDCLYLNVVTPVEGRGLPVMVWIHGGGNVLGEGVQADGGTAGVKLAALEDVVVVSMNYRLGPFGFLAHEALTAESEQNASGNYALMDQVAALKWVRDNIEAFGGDSENVTIFGESAGGLNTCGLLVSPRAQGLFHRAIMQSGTCYRPWPTLDAGEANGARFAELAGCDGEPDVVSCLRAKPWLELHEAWAPAPETTGSIGFAIQLFDVEREILPWSPVLDGYFFEEQPIPQMNDGSFNQVPLMLGFTREEGRLFAWLAEDEEVGAGFDIDETNYQELIAFILGDNDALAAEVAEGPYDADDFVDAGDAYASAATDALFRCPVVEQAAATSMHVPTYMYEFRFRDAAFALDELPLVPSLDRTQFVGWSDGAFHSSEIQYVFGVPALSGMDAFVAGSDDAMLFDRVRGYWARFARSGDPNGDGAPDWPAFSGDGPILLALDTTAESDTGGPFVACEFWQGTDYLVPAF